VEATRRRVEQRRCRGTVEEEADARQRRRGVAWRRASLPCGKDEAEGSGGDEAEGAGTQAEKGTT
jgi:hypothetical protein